MDQKNATNTIARFRQSRDSATRASQRALSFTIGETLVFNPVVWVGVWFWVNDTCLFCGPVYLLPGHIFRFFISCTGPEEIVPVSTRGKRRNNNNNNKTIMPPIEVIANCELCVTGCTCGHTDCESASGHTALH